MEDFDQGSSSFKISKYNSAEIQNIRIGSLWARAHTNSINGDYRAWNIVLDKIWSELAGDLDLSKESNKKIFLDYDSFNKRLSDTGDLFTFQTKGFSKPKMDSNKASMQYAILLEKEIWMRWLQNKQGKGTAYKDEFEDDFE